MARVVRPKFPPKSQRLHVGEIPMGLFIKAGAPDSFWQSVYRTAADFPDLTWSNFICNLVPVTAGNILGGSLMVAAAYWFVYLRKRTDEPRP
jgi:formate transporter